MFEYKEKDLGNIIAGHTYTVSFPSDGSKKIISIQTLCGCTNASESNNVVTLKYTPTRVDSVLLSSGKTSYVSRKTASITYEDQTNDMLTITCVVRNP